MLARRSQPVRSDPRMRISVITPSFNSLPWLKLASASVADQGVELEHVVQDGLSVDGTREWLSQGCPASVAPESLGDAGMYDAINRGFARSRGEILCHLNCDEQLLPGALADVLGYFDRHPEIEVLFADAIVVDQAGAYRFHRRISVPWRPHVETCELSTLTCATFYRRGLIERLGGFDTGYRFAGDLELVRRWVRAGVRMASLGRFTSVFTLTGQNLSLNPKAAEEQRRIQSTAPQIFGLLRPIIVQIHRMRKLVTGGYSARPFSYEVFTQKSPGKRVRIEVEHPSARWRWKLPANPA